MGYQSNEMNSGGYDRRSSSDEIRRDIHRTRADMDDTVDRLQERLKPRHLLDDLLEAFRGSSGADKGSDSVREMGSRVFDKLKEHPMPAALIGAGIAWLMFDSGSSKQTRSGYTPRKWDVPEYSGSFVDARTGRPYTSDYGQNGRLSDGSGPGMMERAKDLASGAAEKLGNAASMARHKAGDALQSAKDAAASMGEKVSDWTSSAGDSASPAVGAVSGYASAASHQASRGYQAGKHYVERGIEEYPMAMGAAALAVGVLTGLLLPHTQTEDRLMGEQADEIKGRAKDAGKEMLESGKHVVAATAAAAHDEAGRQTSGDDSLVQKVKHIAEDVKSTVADSARREGLDPASLAEKGKHVAERAKDAATEETHRQKDHLSR